jgi:Zn-dependent protease with chaperone function
MKLSQSKARRWTNKQIRKNLNTETSINCERYIHDSDKAALVALQKIPLLDKVCNKVLSVLNDNQRNLIDMAGKLHITEKQLPRIYSMAQSICKKINIEMPELYLELDSNVNAYTYGFEKYTIVLTSGALECLEDDELYAVLAHECGHIACKHGLYHTVGLLLLRGGFAGLDEISNLFNKGIAGSLVGGVVSAVDSALVLAFYHWSHCSEFSADRVAAICCDGAKPVIVSMMRLAGGTTHIDSEIDKGLFISQAEEYKKLAEKNKINKALEFWLTKKATHPLLAVRAYEIKEFVASEKFPKK